MAVGVVTRDELIRAARLLFGRDAGRDAAATIAGGVPPGELRRVFRRRALETHPDRAGALGRSEGQLGTEFRALSDAYALLEGVASRRLRVAPAGPAAPGTPPPAAARGAPRPRPAPAAARSPEPYRPAAPLPRRRLRLAEFLYHSGRVSFRVAAEAVVWQRRQRPALGRLAVEWGHLRPEDVPALLSARRRDGRGGELFGEYALRKGLLTAAQLLALIGKQRRLQRPIGRYFVESGLLGEEELAEAERALLLHNARHR